MIRTSLLLITLATYLVSLLLPALHGDGNQNMGLVLLLLGWFQMVDGQCMAWLANPIYAVGVLLFIRDKFKAAAILSLLSCLVGLDTFRATHLSSAVRDFPITSIGSAFFVWEISFVLLGLASIYFAATNSRKLPQ